MTRIVALPAPALRYGRRLSFASLVIRVPG